MRNVEAESVAWLQRVGSQVQGRQTRLVDRAIFAFGRRIDDRMDTHYALIEREVCGWMVNF